MYVCKECWNESIKWTWQCNFCKSWNSLTEFKESKSKKNSLFEIKKQLVKITDSKEIVSWDIIKTSSQELNNLLWWWITSWSIILLSWEPGIWKSTLSLQLANMIDEEIIYVSWEENENQITSRAKRLWIKNDKLSLLCDNNLENILQTLQTNPAKIVIIDSISVIFSDEINWNTWWISQVKEIAEKMVNFWKNTQTTVIIIWHVNKDWNLAWPKTLEHLVDTVLFFEWERYEDIRVLRSLKNRFWSTWEIAIFKMTQSWLEDLTNPSLEFISKENKNDAIWSSLSITLEWSRSILVEIESLTTYTKFGYPKRSARWIQNWKLDLIIAVLSKYSKISLDSYDVYVNIVRWLKIDEPWIDLSIWASIISSKLNKNISRDTIFIWEISLTWKIKNCFSIEKRIKEAQKLWFKNIIIPDIETKDSNLVKMWTIQNLVEYITKI